MSDVLTSLTSFAVSVFRARADQTYKLPSWRSLFPFYDPVLRAAGDRSLILPERHPTIPEIAQQVFSDPDLAEIGPRQGSLDPMVLHAGGGSRMSPEAFITGLLSAALLQIHYLSLPYDESTFVRRVLENFEELRRAARGERVRAYLISGIAGVTLKEGSQISTPWGVLRPAMKSETPQVVVPLWQPVASCVLAEPRLLTVVFDRAADTGPLPDSSEHADEKVRVLLPLACALASPPQVEPIVPVITWSTMLVPFQESYAHSFPILPPMFRADVDITDLTPEIEEWARVVRSCHCPTVDIAASRMASAVAYRLDRADALIDAVMVWENLVGASTELTFRVTAALAKLLEPDPSNRRALRKELVDLYGVRSRLVHGASVDQAEVTTAASHAISVAARALRSCYRRGSEWLALTSTDRADALLLD